jgi:menaquinone reductase, multiheme cytochrome c subunit
MKSFLLAVIFVTIFGGIVLLAILAQANVQKIQLFNLNSKPLKQPFPFNHKIHTESGLDCENCHLYAFTRVDPSIPRLETCMECHEGNIEPPFDILEKYSSDRGDIPWIRLYKLPRHVYFSHKRHALLGKIACQVCHGDVGEKELPLDKPIMATLNMDTCMDCHEQRKVSNDCSACHR